jgi:predicted MFS family arabinose efflux permease
VHHDLRPWVTFVGHFKVTNVKKLNLFNSFEWDTWWLRDINLKHYSKGSDLASTFNLAAFNLRATKGGAWGGGFAKSIGLFLRVKFENLSSCIGSSYSHFEIQTVLIAHFHFYTYLQPVCQTHPGGRYHPSTSPSVVLLLLFYCFVLGCIYYLGHYLVEACSYIFLLI